MSSATIGDDVKPLFEFDWGDRSRTSEEIGDLEAAGFTCSIDDIVEIARDDPDCEVKIIGFE